MRFVRLSKGSTIIDECGLGVLQRPPKFLWIVGQPVQLSMTRQLQSHDVISPMLPAGAAARSDSAATSSSPVETAPMFASPGVYAAETSGRYSSLPQESSLESPIGSPGNGRGNFASADAARVGGGLYGHLLDAMCTLATDPAPSVARMGKAVLLLAGVQITPVMGSPGDLLSCLPALQSLQSPMSLPRKGSMNGKVAARHRQFTRLIQ